MKEISLISYDTELISFKVGSLFSVEFDLLALWETIKDEIPKKEVVFVHTHPFARVGTCSDQDWRVIETIKNTFGEDFEFYFEVFGTEKSSTYFIGKNKSLEFFDTKDSSFDSFLVEISKCA